jgi:hypothetical protein
MNEGDNRFLDQEKEKPIVRVDVTEFTEILTTDDFAAKTAP